MAAREKTLPVELVKKSYDFEKNPPIGIDLGTSNSAIAKWVNTIKMTGSKVYYLNNQDSHLIPSIVYLQEVDGKKDFIVGKEAYKRRISEPENIASSIKREIGYSSKRIRLGDKYMSPINLAAEIIKALFNSAIDTGLRNPAGIVVAVPYYFTQNQNHHTRLALEKAISEISLFNGLPVHERPKVLGLIPEPIAAALSYTSDHMDIPLNKIVLAIDMGGGTLDITVFKIEITGSSVKFEVLATDGDQKFGGEDFDEALENYIIEKENITFDGLNIKNAKKQKTMIRDAVIEAKERLSFHRQVDLDILNLPGGISVSTTIKRSEFETLLIGQNKSKRNFNAEFKEILNRVLSKSKLTNSSISTILPIGGSTKISFFNKILTTYFPNATFLNQKENEYDSLYLSVSKGAALYAAYLLDKDDKYCYLPFDKDITLITRSSHNLGIKKYDDKFSILVPENSIVPTTYNKIFEPIEYESEANKFAQVYKIEIYQGKNNVVSKNTKIGEIKLPPIYTHGRKLEDIKINISFNVGVTTLSVSILIPASNKNKQDIELFDTINLEEGAR